MQNANHADIVINWHITEACNFSCKYCYAQWQDEGLGRELIIDRKKTENLIEQIALFFPSCRLNIAGGEPLLFKKQLLHVLQYANSLGLKTSIITNGSLLTNDYVVQIAKYLSVIGVSIDSTILSSNLKIGRVHKKNNQTIPPEDLKDFLLFFRKLNPNIEIKINTVVNDINFQEDMSTYIESINPNKWKILRMLPVTTQSLIIRTDQFSDFLSTNIKSPKLKTVACIEDNIDMHESYIMIDPHGRFFQNQEKSNYNYSKPILECGIEVAFSQIHFDIKKFEHRYNTAQPTIG